MQVGFIGTGSMGSILIEALLSSRTLLPSQIIAYNRTLSKAEMLAERYPGLAVAASNAEVARSANVIFLCVKPFEYNQALEQVSGQLTERQLLVTITSPVELADLEEHVPCQVLRVVPSITNAALAGTTLIEFGSRATSETRSAIFALFSRISQPVEVAPCNLRIAADLSSCGPAFISYVLQEMILAATEETGITQEAATHLTTEMIIGLAELLKKEIFTLPALQQRVCVPGGITGEGLIPLQQGIPGLFQQVFRRTHEKFAEDCREMKSHLTT